MALIESGWGLEVILWFQSWRTPIMETFGLIFHYAGSEDFYILIIPLVYWCLDVGFGQRLAFFFLITVKGFRFRHAGKKCGANHRKEVNDVQKRTDTNDQQEEQHTGLHGP